MLTPGSVIELVIDKPAAGGRMIARHEGLVVLVSAALPGERVRALVERTGQGVAYAVTVEVLEPSPDRRTGVADWACGGNVYAHVAYPRQLLLKGEVIVDALARIGRVAREDPIVVAPSPERGYRMRARFHVRGHHVGFFREGTHHLCDPVSTGQLLPGTGSMLEAIGELLREGVLRGVAEIELAENIPGTERALHLELDRPAAPSGLARLASLPTVVGVAASFNPPQERERRAPARRGPAPTSWRRTVTAGGSPCVLDTLDLRGDEPVFPPVTARLQHHVKAFFQGNRFLLPALAARVRSLVPQGPVVDLYAGVGLFAVTLAASEWGSVVAVESDRAAAADLRANAAPYGGALQPVEMAVERYLAAHPAGPGVTLVVDPPRTGVSKEAAAALAGQHARRLIYVSCDVATFARDTRRLLDAGYSLDHLEAFDLFPNTAHVECVALFDRN
jgi:23S rRNA (uracil1939-C5)-methyltransferase